MSLLFNHGRRHDLCEGYDQVLGVGHPEIHDLTDSVWRRCDLRDEAGADSTRIAASIRIVPFKPFLPSELVLLKTYDLKPTLRQGEFCKFFVG